MPSRHDSEEERIPLDDIDDRADYEYPLSSRDHASSGIRSRSLTHQRFLGAEISHHFHDDIEMERPTGWVSENCLSDLSIAAPEASTESVVFRPSDLDHILQDDIASVRDGLNDALGLGNGMGAWLPLRRSNDDFSKRGLHIRVPTIRDSSRSRQSPDPDDDTAMLVRHGGATSSIDLSPGSVGQKSPISPVSHHKFGLHLGDNIRAMETGSARSSLEGSSAASVGGVSSNGSLARNFSTAVRRVSSRVLSSDNETISSNRRSTDNRGVRTSSDEDDMEYAYFSHELPNEELEDIGETLVFDDIPKPASNTVSINETSRQFSTRQPQLRGVSFGIFSPSNSLRKILYNILTHS